MRDPLRHHRHHRETLFGSSLAERTAEKFADFMGTVRFLVVSTVLILTWMVSNHLVPFLITSWHGLLTGHGFDPAPFILLNLVFSAFAFYTGALVIIATKAQAKKDRAREEADAYHREEIAQEHAKALAATHELVREIHHHLQERL